MVAAGWTVAIGTIVAIVYGLYDYTQGEVELSNSTSAFYNAVHRTVWAVALGWVVFACVTGYGG